MDIRLSDNKSYTSCNIVDVFANDKLYVKTDILTQLAKSLGFSYPLYLRVANLDTQVADELVRSTIGDRDIILLCDEEASNPIDKVLGYSLEDRAPILNSEFIKRVYSLAETCDEIEIAERYYHKDDTVSSVLLKKKSPIVVEETYVDRESKYYEYEIGVLIMNDELNTTYSRLVFYHDGQPLYLPASMYNTSISRYKKSTSNSVEALEVMILKIIEDLRDTALHSKIYNFHTRYIYNLHSVVTYEEYNTVLKTMRKIPTIIEDNSLLEQLLPDLEEFENKYPHIEDQSHSYIWRCTALGHMTIGDLVSTASKILSNASAPPLEYLSIRELLGSYISTNRIASEIAREVIR